MAIYCDSDHDDDDDNDDDDDDDDDDNNTITSDARLKWLIKLPGWGRGA